jgi:hypothetical protein
MSGTFRGCRIRAWASRNCARRGNYSHDNDGSFLLICNEGGHEQSESVGNRGTIARYNISQNDRTRGIALTGPITDTQIYNDTIFIGPDGEVDVVLYADWKAGWPASTYFYNNIFYALGKAQIAYGSENARAMSGAYSTSVGYGQSTNNVFDSKVFFGEIAAAEDSRGMKTNPRMVSPGSGALGRETLNGYALQADSAARASGRVIPNDGGA